MHKATMLDILYSSAVTVLNDMIPVLFVAMLAHVLRKTTNLHKLVLQEFPQRTWTLGN